MNEASGGATMSRQLKVRPPNGAEMRQLRRILEESTKARLCRWAEALLFYGAGVAEQSPTEFGLPYGRWPLAKLQEYLVHQRHLLKTISREHLRRLLKKNIFTGALF